MLCWVKSDWLKLQGSIINISIQSQVGEQTEDPFTAPSPSRKWLFLAIGLLGASFLVISSSIMMLILRDGYVIPLIEFWLRFHLFRLDIHSHSLSCQPVRDGKEIIVLLSTHE